LCPSETTRHGVTRRYVSGIGLGFDGITGSTSSIGVLLGTTHRRRTYETPGTSRPVDRYQ
jgi:hypothetical protein